MEGKIKKTSYVIYEEWSKILLTMAPEECQQMIKILQDYQNDQIIPENVTPLQNALLIIAMPTMDKNNEKFLNGRKGGRPKKGQTKKDKKEESEESGENIEEYLKQKELEDLEDEIPF